MVAYIRDGSRHDDQLYRNAQDYVASARRHAAEREIAAQRTIQEFEERFEKKVMQRKH